MYNTYIHTMEPSHTLDASMGQFICQMTADDCRKMRQSDWCDHLVNVIEKMVHVECTPEQQRHIIAQRGLDSTSLSARTIAAFYVQIMHVYSLIRLLHSQTTDDGVLSSIHPALLSPTEPIHALYHDTSYNGDTDTFGAMSEEASSAYKSDVTAFYTAFTGQVTTPDHIHTFDDILWSSIATDPPNHTRTPGYGRNQVLRAYAFALRDMYAHIQLSLGKLRHIRDALVICDVEGDEYVNPALTKSDMCACTQQTQDEMMHLFATIARDTLHGDCIYEAFVEHIILESGQRQLIYLSDALSEIADTITSPHNQ